MCSQAKLLHTETDMVLPCKRGIEAKEGKADGILWKWPAGTLATVEERQEREDK